MRYIIILLLLYSISARGQRPIDTLFKGILICEPARDIKMIFDSTKMKVTCYHKFVRVEPDTMVSFNTMQYSGGRELICVFCHKIQKQVISGKTFWFDSIPKITPLNNVNISGSFYRLTSVTYEDGWNTYVEKPNRFTQAAKEAAQKTNEQLKIKNK